MKSNSGGLLDGEFETALRLRPEAGQIDGDAVASRRQQWNRIEPFHVGRGRGSNAGVEIEDGDGGAGQRGPRSIDDAPGERRLLSTEARHRQNQEQQ